VLDQIAEKDKYHKIIKPQNTWFCVDCGNKYTDPDKTGAVTCDCLAEEHMPHLCPECHEDAFVEANIYCRGPLIEEHGGEA
jgi:hypothetical protein